MSLFATHTAWFDPSVPKDIVTQFTANGGQTTKSPTSPHTQLLFSLTPPPQPQPSSTPPLFFHPHWVTASVAAGALQPLSSHLLPPATYDASANAVELHLQVASRMGEEWRKGQQQRGARKKRGRGGRQQKKARVLQDDEADNEVVEVEPPKQTRRRGERSGAASELADGVEESDVQAEEAPKSRRGKRKQPMSERGAAVGTNGDLSFQRWPEMPMTLNGQQRTADDGHEHKAHSSHNEHNSTNHRKRTVNGASRAQQSEQKVDSSTFGAFSIWFADPFAQQQSSSPPQKPPQPAADGEEAEEEDEWEVEAVVDKRTSRRGQVEYRLKWSRADGRPVDEDDLYAWVKASDCNCNELIDQFERRRTAEQDEKAEKDTQQQHTRTVKRAALPSRSKQKQRREEVKEQHVDEEEEDEIVDDDVAAIAAQSFGSWFTEPKFDSIIAELQHTAPRSAAGPPQRYTGRANRTHMEQEEEEIVKEEKGQDEDSSHQPPRTSRIRAASASRSPARPTRATVDRSRQAISDMLAEFDKPLDIDTQHANTDDEAAAADDEVQEVEIHEEMVSGSGDARTLTVKHTILRRSPARLTSLMPFPAITAGRQLFFPRGKSPARVELHEEHKQQHEETIPEGQEDEEEKENVVDLDDQLIPCELCGEEVRADKYEAHVRRCRGGTTGRTRSARTPR